MTTASPLAYLRLGKRAAGRSEIPSGCRFSLGSLLGQRLGAVGRVPTCVGNLIVGAGMLVPRRTRSAVRLAIRGRPLVAGMLERLVALVAVAELKDPDERAVPTPGHLIREL